jgi:Ulp1 family protease
MPPSRSPLPPWTPECCPPRFNHKMDEKLFTVNDIDFRTSDLKSLTVGQWLTDACIDTLPLLINKEEANCNIEIGPARHSPASTLASKNQQQEEEQHANNVNLIQSTTVSLLSLCPDITNEQLRDWNIFNPHSKSSLVLFPLNNGNPYNAHSGSHWSLLVLTSATTSTARWIHLDSCNGLNHTIAKQLIDKLRTNKPLPFVEPTVQQQTNNHDCGIFVIHWALCLMLQRGGTEGQSMEFPNIDSNQLRKEYYNIIQSFASSQIHNSK